MAANVPPRRSSLAAREAQGDQVIDVGSLAPALLPSSPGGAASGSHEAPPGDYVPARRGSRALSLSGVRPPVVDGKKAQEVSNDTPHEHQYPRGRTQVPMDSPGDELGQDLRLDGEDDDALSSSSSSVGGAARVPRRMRNRVFFQSDDIPRSYRYRSSAGVLQRITLRRRKRGPHDWFWTAIALTTLLSLSLLTGVVIYLMQTDFFASHQTDLLGTTVENRFTVVSKQDSSAKIYLKSGYASEAMVAFSDGELRVGRRAIEASEPQSFFGMSLFTNGTAEFTNRVEAPSIATEYLYATKAVVFDDGTVMTTAANMSGGVKEVGDLNLVSQSGSVVTSAGGKPLLVVDPSGGVTVANSNADDPTASGIKLNGAKGTISIASDFALHHDGNISSLSTPLALRLNSSGVMLSSATGGKVTLTVAGNDVGEIKAAEEERELEGEGAANSQGESANSESVTMQIVGQSSSTQSQGGDLHIAGGDGLEVGGDIVLVGGVASDTSLVEYGTISINAELDKTSTSLTEIGSHSKSHTVNLHGMISMNRKISGSFDNSTAVRVSGGLFNVSAQRISLNNTAVPGSRLRIDSKDLRIGTTGSPSIKMGQLGHSDVVLEGADLLLDASEDISIGAGANVITIGKSSLIGQSVGISSESLHFDASSSLSIHPSHTNAKTTVFGQVLFKGNSTTAVHPVASIDNVAVAIDAPELRIGSSGQTTDVSIEATEIVIGEPEVNGSLVTGRVEISSAKIEIGAEDSLVSLQGTTVTVDAQEDVVIGNEAGTVDVGSENTNQATLRGKQVAVQGAVTMSGNSLAVDSSTISFGKNKTTDINIGSAATNTISVDGQKISIGSGTFTASVGSSGASTIEIGSADATINLMGQVTVNGDDLATRRRLVSTDESKVFGYLNAKRFTVDISSGRNEFGIPFEDGFASDPARFQVATATERFLSIERPDYDEVQPIRHVQLSLSIARLRIRSSSNPKVSSKMRCSIFRRTTSSSDIEVVVEANADVNHCESSECDNGIFNGLTMQRIIRLGPGDSFSTKCLVVTQTSSSKLLVDDAQYNFVEL